METLEVMLVIFLTIYVIALLVDEITYLCRGYRVIVYKSKRSDYIDLNRIKLKK